MAGKGMLGAGFAGPLPKKIGKDWTTKYAISRILDHSLKLVYRFMKDESVSIDKRAEMASRFALKHMPENLIVDQTITLALPEKEVLVRLLDELKTYSKSRPQLVTDRNEVTIDVTPEPE